MFLIFVFIQIICAQWLLLEEGGPEILGTEQNAQPRGSTGSTLWCVNDDMFLLLPDSPQVWKYEKDTRRWLWQPNAPRIMGKELSHWELAGKLWLFANDGKLWSYEPESRQWTSYVAPLPFRSASAYWTHKLTTKFYLYGGINNQTYDELWAFDVETLSWTPISYTGDGPGKVAEIVAVLGKNEDTVYIFGGSLTQMYQLDLPTKTWSKTPALQGPEARTHHIMWKTPKQDQVAVFGGQSGAKIFKDIWFYNVELQQWIKDDKAGGPEARYGSSSCVDNKGTMFMHSGSPEDSTRLYSDIWQHGPLTSGNIFQLIEFKLDTATLAALLGGAMSTILVCALFIGMLCLCIIRCRRRNSTLVYKSPLNDF